MIPADWLDASKMARIVCHWTAGYYTPSALDRSHYHFLIDGRGNIHRGDLPVSANLSTKDGVYAQHTKGLNTGSIGVAVCAMAGALEGRDVGKCPVTAAQVNVLVSVCAQLCDHYGLPVTPKTLLGHNEVEAVYSVQQNGKWDIGWLPALGHAGRKCMDLIRESVSNKLKEGGDSK